MLNYKNRTILLDASGEAPVLKFASMLSLNHLLSKIQRKAFSVLLFVLMLLTSTLGPDGKALAEVPPFTLIPIENSDNSSETRNVVFSIRDTDLVSVKSSGGSDPMILGQVDHVAKFVDNLASPQFSVAVFKVLSDGTEEWRSTSSHHYNTSADRFRFRIPLGGFDSSTGRQKYRFYVLTGSGANITGPFEQEFTLQSDSTILDIGEVFPDDLATQIGMNEDQLSALLKFVAQRIIVKRQDKRRSLGSTKLNANNTIELTIPSQMVKVEKNNNAPSIITQIIDGGTSNGATASGPGVDPKGAFSSGLAYEIGDIVTNDSSSFIAKKAVPAGQTAPTRSNINDASISQYWMLLAASGRDGVSAGGSTGATGATGAAGASLNPRGAFSSSATYAVRDMVFNDNSSFMAITTVAAGLTAPTIANINTSPTNTRWMLVAAGGSSAGTSGASSGGSTTAPVATSESVSLPTNTTAQAAANSINNYDGASSTALGVVLSVATAGGTQEVVVRFASGTTTPSTYQINGGTTTAFGTVPVSSGTKFTVPGMLFSFYVSANKVYLINEPVITGDSPTAKTVTIGYQST